MRASIVTRFGAVSDLEAIGGHSDIQMRTNTWRLGGIMVLSSSSSPYRIRVPGSPPLSFVVPIAGSIGLASRTQDVEARSSAHGIVSGNAQFLQARGGRRSIVASAFMLDPGLAASFAPATGNEVDLTVDRLTRVAVADPAVASLSRLLQFVVKEIEHASTSGGRITEGQLIAQLVTIGLLRLGAGERPGEVAAEPAFLRRAEEYMRAHAAEDLSILELCIQVGRSIRALQLAFKRYRGITPLEFLRNCRLDLARERLISRRQGETVGSIARQCGYSHLGRFSADYAQRFGELPSATLRLGSNAYVYRPRIASDTYEYKFDVA